MEVVNIDEVIPKDKEFTLAGKTYKLPGSLPVRRMLELMRFSQRLEKDETDVEAFEGSINTVASIVAIKNKGMDMDAFLDAMTIEAYKSITEIMYTQDKEEDKQKN